jgi:hypothetical protein
MEKTRRCETSPHEYDIFFISKYTKHTHSLPQDNAILNNASYEGISQVAAALTRVPFSLNPKAATPVPFMQLQHVLIDPVQLCLYRANDIVLRAVLMGDAGSTSLDMTPSATRSAVIASSIFLARSFILARSRSRQSP